MSIFKSENSLKYAVIASGISCLTTQIILLREFLSVFYGNELVIGIILANWMFLVGTGSYLGQFFEKVKNKINYLIIFQILIAVLPIITVFLIYSLRNVVFPIGSMISIIHILFSSFLLLIPYCIISGFLFTLFCIVISEKYGENRITQVYYLEALGDIIGGLLFNFILIYFFRTFQSLTVIMAINLISAIFLSFSIKKKLGLKFFIGLFSLFILVAVISIDLDTLSKEILYKGQDVIEQKDTQYGNLVITQTAEQKNFFENGVLLFSTNSPIENEEAVHYAMIQHTNPKNVLLISGGISGVTHEILKYDVERIDYVELNPALIEIGKKYTTALESEKINVIPFDAKLYIRETKGFYDVVLINLPEPTTAQINRFYTIEFFKELKEKLNKDAVVSTSLMSTINYVSDEAKSINSVLYNTLKSVFKNVLIIPGGKNYFLASDYPLSIEIAKKISENPLIAEKNVYVNQYYIDDNLYKERSSFILNQLDKNSKINKDFTPVSYYQHLLYWLSYFSVKKSLIYWIIGGIFFALIIFMILRLNTISLGLFSAGFAASSLEIVLLISFQVIYGYVYKMTGIIITLFMIGLAFGALSRNQIFSTHIKNFIKIQFILAIYSILLPFLLIILKNFNINTTIIHIIFFLVTLDIATLIGMLFSLSAELNPKRLSTTAGELYSADLLGSSIGAILVSALLIPLLGIVNVCIILGLLNVICGIISLINRKKYLFL